MIFLSYKNYSRGYKFLVYSLAYKTMKTYKLGQMVDLVITSITVLVIVIMMILTQKKMMIRSGLVKML